MINFQYVRTNTAKAAVAQITKDKSAKLIAGGTNLVDLMKAGVVAPEKLVDINTVPFKNIEIINNVLHIGALATNSAVADHPVVKTQFPLLSLALQAGASAQLRNMATVGGNMMQRTRCAYFYDTTMPCNKRTPGTGCGAKEGFNRMHAIFGTSDNCIAVHPSDMCVALAALDATVVITGTTGERKLKFTDFHRLPGTTPEKDNNLLANEMIIRVEVPVNKFAANSHYLKIRDRASYAFALVSVAVAVEKSGDTISNVKLAMGGVAHKPWRLTEAETFLKGKSATLENYEKAAAIAITGAKTYKENTFKPKMAANAIIDALTQAVAKV
ncbi:MAG: xanthine dehydrogenase family protein subunit M [Pedobacter sp.]|nr:MAG: xanthine dehydrogenase family protein subunit M [Pedobacter sp.]